MAEQILTVSALNKYLSFRVENDPQLKNFTIQGELSGFKISSGNAYFNLKDSESQIRVVMFGSSLTTLTFRPETGQKVIITGRLNIYVKGGSYAIIARKMVLAGKGAIYEAFLASRERLQKEGLFAAEKKLPLPAFPETIGVITSPTGDALHDIVTTIGRRFPIAQIYLYPALVQGSSAPASLLAAFRRAESSGNCDLIIIARGGGSYEDLIAFNDEALTRAVAASRVPTISGVGHEPDETLIDYAVSRRAPTPTGAAELAVPNQDQLRLQIAELVARAGKAITGMWNARAHQVSALVKSNALAGFINRFESRILEYDNLVMRLAAASPAQYLARLTERETQITGRLAATGARYLDGLALTAQIATNRLAAVLEIIRRKAQAVALAEARLASLNPAAILTRGYAFVTKEGAVVGSSRSLAPGDAVELHFADGKKKAEVKE